MNTTQNSWVFRRHVLGPLDEPATLNPVCFFLTCQNVMFSQQGQGQRVHVRDAEGKSARLPITINISPCPKKKNKEKASIKVSTIAPGQNTLHVGAAVSYCVIRVIGKPDKPRFQRAQLQRSEQKNCKTHHESSWAERPNSIVAGGSTTNFQVVSAIGIYFAHSFCTPRAPRRSAQDDRAFCFAHFFHLTIR